MDRVKQLVLSLQEDNYAVWALEQFLEDPERFEDEGGEYDTVQDEDTPPFPQHRELVQELRQEGDFSEDGFVKDSLWLMYHLEKLVI